MDGPLVEEAERLDARGVELEQRQRDPDDRDRAEHQPARVGRPDLSCAGMSGPYRCLAG